MATQQMLQFYLNILSKCCAGMFSILEQLD